MIDESNIPRFKQRLEIRYDHRPALRHGPMNLESGCSIEWVSVSFADAPVGSIS